MTVGALRSLRRIRHRLCRDTSGLALIEFALTLPIILSLGLTGAELTNYITTRMRISQVALQLADNAARMGSGSMLQARTISESDINDMLTGAGYQAGELDLFQNGRVIVSSLEPVASPNPTNRYKIGWQRCRGAKTTYVPRYGTYNQGSGKNMTGMGPSGQQIIAPDNGGSMFVEIYYDYKPLIDVSGLIDGLGARRIDEYASMMIRDRRDMTQVYNTEGATPASC